MKIKNVLIVLIMIGVVSHLSAQEKKISILPTIGVSKQLLNEGTAYHLGVNPSYRFSEKFSGEAQISYLYFQNDGSFLSGNTGFENMVNALIGGRFYLNAEDKKTRFFLNVLAGINYTKEELNSGVENDGEFNVGYSVGSFIDFNKIVIGLTFDAPQNIVLKLGYSL